MSAFRLEIISPSATQVRRVSAFERRLEAVREEAFEAGFVAGQGAAVESHLEDQGRLTAEFVEALDDARMTNEAARRHVAASLAPVLVELARAIAPALAQAGIAAEIERLVARAVAAAPEARPRLRVAPEMATRIAETLAARDLDARVEPAPELLPREVQVFWDQGYDHLDLDACAAELLARIAACIDPQRDEPDNEHSRT